MELKEGVIAAVSKVIGTANDQGIFYVNPKSPMIAQAVNAGAVEVNTGLPGETEGQFAARLTEAGKAFFASATSSAEASTPKPVENGSNTNMNEADTGGTAANIAGYAVATVAAPVRQKRGKWTEIFERLGDGQSVFIPATADMENPKDTLASTITGQNKREKELAAKNGTVAKYFKTYTIEDGADWGHAGAKGAAIFRLDSERPSK